MQEQTQVVLQKRGLDCSGEVSISYYS